MKTLEPLALLGYWRRREKMKASLLSFLLSQSVYSNEKLSKSQGDSAMWGIGGRLFCVKKDQEWLKMKWFINA